MNYSSKENVNILTSLLVAHGVRHAVVCPGSRNAPIVHNLNNCGDIECHSVTDERSAGFYAVGMACETDAPVAVCVTSGSALLNLAPAVAEAHYRHVPLIVISADRPQAWIGQLDGQTLPQPGAFGGFVTCSITLPEPVDDVGRWHCNRLVNEALLAACSSMDGCPVQINVPVTEPLFEFTVAELPEGRVIRKINTGADVGGCCRQIADRLAVACRPMLIVGQYPDSRKVAEAMYSLSKYMVVIHEPLSPGGDCPHIDEVISRIGSAGEYKPDFILYAGDTVVSKRLKKFVRSVPGAETWAVSPDGKVHDTLMNQTVVIQACAGQLLPCLASCFEDCRGFRLSETARMFCSAWNAALAEADKLSSEYAPQYSQMMAVKMFEQLIGDGSGCRIHYANSSAVRLANIYARHHVCVNRGVNGIEGSLSAAAGCSIVTDKKVYCVIGDLSFFYDSNALWNSELRGNMRILLLNNGCGGIFHHLPGLERSDARDRYVAAGHDTTARGICNSYGIRYMAVYDEAKLKEAMNIFVAEGVAERPLLMEVFTNPEYDAAALDRYYDIYNR